jgi:endonuclease/exonuclease/phosphatase family metal-dependent hydrolase
MIAIVCWNIRWGEGRDGRVDLARMVDSARAMGHADVYCFQEVARHFPALDGGAGADQVERLRACLPGFEVIFGAAVDVAGERTGVRRQFGNLVLTRPSALQVYRHQLPRPAEPAVPHMPRQALEVVIATAAGPLRIVTTHLEYYSAMHRAAQVERLRGLYQEASAHPRARPPAAADKPMPPALGPCPTLLCGDFNMERSEPAYGRLLSAFDDGTPALLDAWTVVHPGTPHAPTCGLYELVHWPGANTRDFMFISSDLAARARALDVDLQTDASDHQPLRLVLDL